MRPAAIKQQRCVTCGRTYRINRNGVMRKHWCRSQQDAPTRTLHFKHGGSLTIIGAFNLLLLQGPERDFYSTVTDAVLAYEQACQLEVARGE